MIQPALGKVADVWSYSTSYLVAAGVHLLGVPFVVLARRRAGSRTRSSPSRPSRGVDRPTGRF